MALRKGHSSPTTLPIAAPGHCPSGRRSTRRYRRHSPRTPSRASVSLGAYGRRFDSIGHDSSLRPELAVTSRSGLHLPNGLDFFHLRGIGIGAALLAFAAVLTSPVGRIGTTGSQSFQQFSAAGQCERLISRGTCQFKEFASYLCRGVTGSGRSEGGRTMNMGVAVLGFGLMIIMHPVSSFVCCYSLSTSP